MKYESPVLEIVLTRDVIATSLKDEDDLGFGNETDY